MPMDYNLLRVAPEKIATEAKTKDGRLRVGYARLQFHDTLDELVFDLRRLGRHQQKFRNWAKKQFGYLRYSTFFGSVNA